MDEAALVTALASGHHPGRHPAGRAILLRGWGQKLARARGADEALCPNRLLSWLYPVSERSPGRVWQVALNASDADRVRSIGCYNCLAGVETDGAWRSTDGGEHWEKCSEDMMSQDIHGFAVVHNVARSLYATTNTGLHVSEDTGEN